jgi:adenosylcobinamide-GDP ribazoletransferase
VAATRTKRRTGRTFAGARLAVGLLTVIPVRACADDEGIGPAAAWFPLVGAVIGLAVGAVRLAADGPLGHTVAAVLAVIVLVVLTGALHQDGLADLADGLGVRGGRERRLEVMRGSTLGAFGVLALVLWALLLVATVAALPRHRALSSLVIACALGRWAAVVHAAALPPARRDGLGAAFRPALGAVIVATVLVGATGALQPLPALAALAVALAVAAGTGVVATRTLGGRTGDTLGATVALTEAAACMVLLAFAR